MGRRHNKRAQNRGPWDWSHIEKQLKRVGYEQVPGAKHRNFKHPDRAGKVSVSDTWTGIVASDAIFRSLCRQSGFSKSDMLRILNGFDPEG